MLLSAPAWPLSPRSPAPSPALLSTPSQGGEERAQPRAQDSPRPLPFMSVVLTVIPLFSSALMCIWHTIFFSHLFLASLNQLFSKTFFFETNPFFGCIRQHVGSTRGRICAPAMEVWRLNHRATRGAPKATFKNFFFIMCCCFECFT